jgi:hypothetical protein
MNAATASQPGANCSCLVRSVIVHYQMNVELGRNGFFGGLKVLGKRHAAMTAVHLTDDFAGGDIERCKQLDRSVAHAVVGASPRDSRSNGQISALKRASSIKRGSLGRGALVSPCRRVFTRRARQLYTVCFVIRSLIATSLLSASSALAKTIQARSASACVVLQVNAHAFNFAAQPRSTPTLLCVFPPSPPRHSNRTVREATKWY